MKIEKPKHNHKLTEWLKVIIFSLLMLAPLFAACSQWVYVSINKNAYQSYSGTVETTTYEPKYLTNIVNSQNDLINGNYYSIKYDTNYAEQLNTNTTTQNLPFKYNKNPLSNITNNTNGRIYMRVAFLGQTGSTSYANILLYNNDDTYNNEWNILEYDNTITNSSLNIVENRIYSTNNEYLFSIVNVNNLYCPLSFDTVIVESTTLDNAFYYGVDQMTKSELFNWTQNTAVYTGIKAMTDNLQIQTNAIAILLTYWFILTIIYIIVDIVLKLFTTMTHLLVRGD